MLHHIEPSSKTKACRKSIVRCLIVQLVIYLSKQSLLPISIIQEKLQVYFKNKTRRVTHI